MCISHTDFTTNATLTIITIATYKKQKSPYLPFNVPANTTPPEINLSDTPKSNNATTTFNFMHPAIKHTIRQFRRAQMNRAYPFIHTPLIHKRVYYTTPDNLVIRFALVSAPIVFTLS